MPSDDLKAHAASNQDFYALLEISPAAQDSEIRRAYRRAALKYHPDKIANPKPADIDKFHLLQIANDVLSEPAVRQLYDNAREARLRKKREMDMLDGAKRKMREDLEARERAAGFGFGAQRGVKRTWMGTSPADGSDESEDKLQREVERIAEDGRRRRREAEERLRREMAEEGKIMQREQEEEQRAADRSNHRVDRSHEGGGANVGMLERSIKIRWVKEGHGMGIDKDRLVYLFSPFGKIENAFTLKDKKQRIGDRREKKVIGTGVVVYSSIVSAHAAVLDSEKKKRQESNLPFEDDWALIESVSWASGDAPDLGIEKDKYSPKTDSSSTTAHPPPDNNPSRTTASHDKPSFSFNGIKTSIPDSASKKPGGKAPSFGSFSPAAAATNSTETSKSDQQAKGASAPSFQELTFMRLKNAQREKERKALEEEIRQEDEAADAAEAAAPEAKTS